MNRNPEMITTVDHLRLTMLLDDDETNGSAATALEEKLARAAVIDPKEAPSDLVTMNSVIQGPARQLTLVYPRDADISAGRISILAPLGAELLGARAGQWVSWRGVDGGLRSFLVDRIVYQPEANGDWHL